jgi:hypothetical protein
VQASAAAAAAAHAPPPLLMRLTDDYLFVTTDRVQAVRFVRRMQVRAPDTS